MEPRLLIASPQMRDPFFSRTVVLLWHHDEDGAIGVVVNRLADHQLLDIIDIDDQLLELNLTPYMSNRVGWGGPVESASGTVITRGRIREEEGWILQGQLRVTRSQDALVRLMREGADIHLVLGYAGWGPGQLDQEIEEGGWLWTDCDAGLIFDHEADERYEIALASLGLSETTVWMQPINE